MLNQNILWLVPVISLFGSGSYIYQVIKGKARPNRVTWVLWALAPLIAFAAEIHEGVGLESILTFMAGFGPLLVLISSFVNPKSVWKITSFDIVCGALSILGLVLWLITRHSNLAIIFSICADLLAGTPTLLKSYRDPDSESYYVFLGGMADTVLTLLTIKHWTFANWGFPIYIGLICLTFVVLIKFQLGLRITKVRQSIG